ncbi:hypothetical protein GCM10027217_46340 [Pseudomaricurvus hydrocarbonicus]
MSLFQRRDHRGFTLLELQLALVIVALMGMLLFEVLQLGARSWRSVTDRSLEAEKLVQVQNFLRRQLRLMHNNQLRDENGKLQTAFYGDHHRISFVAPPPGPLKDASLYWWTLVTTYDEETQQSQLMLGYQPYELTSNDVTQGNLIRPEDWSRMFDRATTRFFPGEFEFEYWDSQEGWLTEWQRQPNLPVMVRVQTVNNDEKNLSHWPLLMIIPLQRELDFSAGDERFSKE